jgi:hypothetical protein
VVGKFEISTHKSGHVRVVRITRRATQQVELCGAVSARRLADVIEAISESLVI